MIIFTTKEQQFLHVITTKYKRIGLALSGGGYRASFFHLGVLANLAEKNLLKDVSVLSTVSGGSIIGALYFIKLRNKLQEKKQLTHADYIDIVKELEADFTNGVSKKIRKKVFLHPVNELRIVFQHREKLLARLYEKYFYKLKYTMADLQESGLPKLIINATLLENGGPWYFSQFNMGQYPESDLMQESKGILSYDNNQIYLRDAVASSSAVPGLFTYVKIKHNGNSYKLVDGGAFDNLGLFSLQKEECDFFIVSDGSKQLTVERNTPRKRLSVLKRSYDASLELNKKLMLSACSNYVHMHLKENYTEVNAEVSDALSKLRTDLNDFSLEERRALSHFGYLLTEKINVHFPVLEKIVGDFGFKDRNIIDLMQAPNDDFITALRNGSKLNSARGKGLRRNIVEIKYSLSTFVLLGVIIFYFALFGAFEIIPANDAVLVNGVKSLLIAIELVAFYLMAYSTIDDNIHYIDMVLAKILHLALSIIYLLVIIGAAGVLVFFIWLTCYYLAS